MARDTAPQFGVAQDFGKNFHDILYGLTSTNKVIPIKIKDDGSIDVNAVLDASDIEIGAVEIKDGSTDQRATVNSDGELLVAASTTPVALMTSVITRVNSSVTSQTLLSANTSRKGLLFYNDSNAQQFIKFGATASTTDFTVRLTGQSFYEVQTPVYGGQIDVISSSTNGAIQVTELS